MDGGCTQVVVLGCTGSIGTAACDVIAANRDSLNLFGATGHANLPKLRDVCETLRPRFFIATDETAAAQERWDAWPSGTTRLNGPDAVAELASRPEVDVVLAAMVGSVGLYGALGALEAGKRLALANKETLVAAGPLVTKMAAERGSQIIPVDSEHSAIFQCFQSGRRSEVKRIVLTASGGPFRKATRQEMETATLDEALSHPTWRMGKKITIDSATMMNKALEIIEARWLFNLRADQIDVVIHPQSIVHSFVEFVDGSVMAQLSPPDMRLPIQYALTYPHRQPSPARKLDLTEAVSLDFEPPDEDRFPALQLGREAAAKGGTAGAVLNAANEAAVAAFLRGEIGFMDISRICRDVLDGHHFEPRPSLDDILKWDRWAREEVSRWKCSRCS